MYEEQFGGGFGESPNQKKDPLEGIPEEERARLTEGLDLETIEKVGPVMAIMYEHRDVLAEIDEERGREGISQERLDELWAKVRDGASDGQQ
ncbi:MAG: hypothetical protein WCO52_05735 [bacterium]